MKAPVRAAHVTWSVASHSIECDECPVLIMVGERMGSYTERGLDGYAACRVFRRTRHYCAECAQLLEDSLTTTENV